MARLLYKCRLCGKIDDSLGIGDKFAEEFIIKINKTGKWSNRWGDDMYKKDYHTCSPESKYNPTQIGVTDFIGVRMEEK